MTLDYFYGAQADQFAFYRIPKALFTDERFKSISAEAKILYGILLDRMSLSRKNGWLDEQGRVFIIFTLEEVMEATASYPFVDLSSGDTLRCKLFPADKFHKICYLFDRQ